jgi:hypothetical protein
MASKRLLKKHVGEKIDALLGQCFDYIDQGGSEEKAETIMDEVADLYFDCMSRIRVAKAKGDIASMKADLAAKYTEFAKRINAL